MPPSAQNIMLAVHCKRTEQADLKAPILSYIKATYSDAEAEEAADDLGEIQGLRNELVQAQAGSQGAKKETLVKYLKALATIETRFPISGEKGHAKVQFPWADAFRPAKKAHQANIHFEKAAILFNLAAVLSQQALQVERGTAEGLTQACKLFQESAGMFAHLREAEANKVDAPRPVDLSPEACSLMEKLMLAQAQECVYHKAVMDKKSPGVVSRLAKQAALMYGEVAALFNAPVLLTHFEKSWVSHAQMKASLMEVQALVEAGKQLHDDTKVSKEIATLSEAFTRLQATKKLATGISQELGDSLKGLEEGLVIALTKAQKENNSVYLEKVPAFADLPPIQGACLVKAAAPANLEPDGSENYFSSLVPDSSAKALSKYTDMVDTTVRGALDKLAGATDAARLALRQAELPELLEALDGASPSAVLPEGLARELDEVAAIGGAAHLRGILSEIGDLRRNVEADLVAAQKALDEEAAADAAGRAEYGDRWSVPQSATLAKHLVEKLSGYRTTLAQAGESDGKVITRLNDSEAAFAGLTPAAAAAQMPRLQAPLVPMGPEDPAAVVASLRRGMEALSTLSTERAGLEEALKELKTRDNILPKLMASPSSAYDALFEREIGKYSKLVADAAASAARNEELLGALGRDAQAFRTVFEVNSWRSACEAAAGGVRGVLKSYREVLDHLSEGLRFYMSLQEAVKSHVQQVTDFSYTRSLQRDDLRRDLERRAREEREAAAAKSMAYLSVNPPPPQAPAYPAPPPSAGYYQHGAPPPPPHGGYQHPPPPGPPQQPYPPQQPAYGAPPQPPQQQQAYGYAPPPPPPQQQQQPPYPQQQHQQPPAMQSQGSFGVPTNVLLDTTPYGYQPPPQHHPQQHHHPHHPQQQQYAYPPQGQPHPQQQQQQYGHPQQQYGQQQQYYQHQHPPPPPGHHQ